MNVIDNCMRFAASKEMMELEFRIRKEGQMRKKNWEIYRDTKTLGTCRLSATKFQETPKGDVVTWFNDAEYWADKDQFVRERDMVIGDMVFHITSVFLDEDRATSTPTDKQLSHIDMQMKKETAKA